jgi:tetratricopeptide (TPR) repeat protein
MVLRSSERQARALFESARRLACGGHYDRALVALNQALEQVQTAQLYDYRGVVLSLTLQNEAALESFDRALVVAQSNSERAEIYFHRGLLHGREGAYNQALQDFMHACQLNPHDLTYREAYEQLRNERGEGEESSEYPYEASPSK